MENLKYFLKSKTLVEFLTKIKNNGIKQAYLFSSLDKDKNYASCIILSLILNCKNNLCLNCPSCTKIINDNSVDLLVYPKSKTILVDDIEGIIETCNILPLENDYKIYILNNFDEANITSQNKFLKTLEEPPKNVIFLINSTKTDMILDTIKSRCEKIILPKLNKDEIENIISSFNIEDDIICLENCNGEIGNYLNLLSSKFSEKFKFCLNLLKNMNLSSEMLYYSTKILKDKGNLENYFDSFISIFNDILVCKYDQNKVKNKSSILEIKLLSEKFSEKAVNEILKNIIKSNNALSFNTNESLVIDALLIDILEEKHKWN